MRSCFTVMDIQHENNVSFRTKWWSCSNGKCLSIILAAVSVDVSLFRMHTELASFYVKYEGCGNDNSDHSDASSFVVLSIYILFQIRIFRGSYKRQSHQNHWANLVHCLYLFHINNTQRFEFSDQHKGEFYELVEFLETRTAEPVNDVRMVGVRGCYIHVWLITRS